MRLSSRLIVAALFVTISGCLGGNDSAGDGSGSTPPPPSPPPPTSALGGLWSGAIFWDPKDGFPGGALSIRALVAETGEFRMVLYEEFEQRFSSQSEQIFGTFNINGPDISTTGDAVWAAGLNATGDNWAAFGMAGDFEDGESISGTFQANFAGWTHVEDRVGTLSLNYHSLYERPSSLDILQGTYSTLDEVLTIDGQGVLFYQSSITGCTGNGTAGIINPDFNMYRVEIEVGSCTGNDAIRNGLIFTGLANLGENNEPGGGFLNATLEMGISAEIGLPFSSGHLLWNLLALKD